MTAVDRNTLLTIVYCLVDDLYRRLFAPLKPRRRGHQPELSDSEVLPLALLAQWQPERSEAAFLEYVRWHWRRWLSRQRQVVETINAALDATFGLSFPRARSLCGLLTRIAAKVAAFNIALYLNALLGRRTFAFLNPLTAS